MKTQLQLQDTDGCYHKMLGITHQRTKEIKAVLITSFYLEFRTNTVKEKNPLSVQGSGNYLAKMFEIATKMSEIREILIKSTFAHVDASQPAELITYGMLIEEVAVITQDPDEMRNLIETIHKEFGDESELEVIVGQMLLKSQLQDILR